MNEYYAHTAEGNPDKSAWQRLEEHLQQTAILAEKFANVWGLSNWGYLAGLWHDIGKYSTEFQQRLNESGGENAHLESRNRVDHSTAGAQHAVSTLDNEGKILAYVIAGHHGGLPDGNSPDACLRKRLEKVIPDFSGYPEKFLAKRPELQPPFVPTPDRAGMQISMFVRMLYSCLVDADFLDTERFMNSPKNQSRQGSPQLSELATVFFQNFSAMRERLPETPVNSQREQVLNKCVEAAKKDTGLFSLTVPTGGGKTLSSMAFALKHAIKHGLQRIIYVIPYTSIIEQNASVFRSMLGEDYVLEHHSNFEPENEDYRSRLACENWDAPIIVTTNVQFFESLFSNRSSRCRKLHNIANSVIILDEVQTIPAPYLLPCLETLKELVTVYRTSIVLCSATQPAIQKRPDFLKGLEDVTEIVDNPQQLARSLKRTTTTLLPKSSDVEITKQIDEHHQVLCIVNTRMHARKLYTALSGVEGKFHLSALMCPEHRSQKLTEIRQVLTAGQRCQVVSTQLVEAGVDIDFPVVYRAIAGIDSIAQAAGRCNREGKLPRGKVFVFTPEDGIPAGHLRQTAQTAESTIRRYGNDILSLEAIEDYFQNYYWMKGDHLDAEKILPSLNEGIAHLNFPFKTIAEQFRFIKDDMKPVIIPFNDDARELIRSVSYVDYPTSLSRKLQRFTVSVYPTEWNRLLASGSIEIKSGMFPVLINETVYKEDLGLCVDASAPDPESLVV